MTVERRCYDTDVAPVPKAHISCGRGIACLLSWCAASPTELSGSETEWGDSETEAESDNTDIQQKARCTTTIIEISDDEEAPS